MTSTEFTPEIFVIFSSSGSVVPNFSSMMNIILTADNPKATGTISIFVYPSPANPLIKINA